MNHIAWQVCCRFACLATALAVIVGCGKGGLTTIPVEGQVTVKGQPLINGEVVFHPTNVYSGGPSRQAMGRLDAEGRYTLSTLKHGDGVQPGEYGVVIANRAPGRVVDAEENVPLSSIPAVYSSITTTPLKAIIPADASGKLEFNFDLNEK